jgi:hypothetical protein
MVLRRGLADALEFLGADANLGYPAVIVKFGIDVTVVGWAHHPKGLGGRHGVARMARARHTDG